MTDLVFDLDQRLTLSEYLVLIDRSEDVRTVLHARVHSQLELTDEAWALLQRFAEPTTARRVLGGLERSDADDLAEILATFVDLGWLVAGRESDALFEHGDAIARAQASALLPVGTGLLGAHTDGRRADINIVGIPFDRLAMQAGCAAAPSALRDISQGMLACIDPETGCHRGIYDQSAGRLRMAGVSLSDHGDVRFELGEAPQTALDRVGQVAREFGDREAPTIFIGGDHSITPALFDGIAREPLTVVHFDAHSDLDTVFRGRVHHHGNFMERLRRHPAAVEVVQLGLRDLAPPWFRAPDSVHQYGMDRLSECSVDQVCALIPDDRPCYVTVDIDVLDPSSAPGTGAPVPGGVALPRLEALLAAIATRRTVRAVDLVEVSPSADVRGMTQLSALRLLVRMIDALTVRR